MALVDTMGHGAAADPATTSGPVVDVTLVIHADDPDRVHTPDGVTLAPDVTRHLRCDPIFHPLITNSPGETLHAGRAARHANRAQRRALTHRDGGCRFPGCDRPPNRCNAHHIIAWDHHGPTDMSNLILLCRYHHGVTHRSGWTLTAHPDHTFTWTTPNGHTLTSHPRGRPPDP
ncbi:MAG TPA: HNH endonuclease signature motif containing protein [Acidimicrobiales bacterium]